MKGLWTDHNLTILFISTFLFFTNEALFLPTLPVHLATGGYDHFRVGCVLGAFALGVLISRPVTGLVTDRIGRKAALATGVFFFFASPVFYLFSIDFYYLLGVRFVHGLGIAFYTSAFPAYVTDRAPADRRAEILGYMSTATTMAFALGPLCGTSVYGAHGFSALVWVCTAVGLVNLILILTIQESRDGREIQKIRSYKATLLRRSIIVSSAIQVMHGMVFGGIMTFLPLLFNQIQGVSIGLFFLVESVAVICFRILGARLADIYGRGPVYFYASLTVVGALMLIPLARTLPLLVCSAVLAGLGSALSLPALLAFVADRSHPGARGMVYSVVYAAFDTGVIAAGIILGWIADITGLEPMFRILAVANAAALAGFALMIRKGAGRSLAWTLVPRRRGP